MKIRHPWIYWLVGVLGAWVIRLWMGSLRWRIYAADPRVDPDAPTFSGRYIYAFWHECMLYPAYLYAIPDVKVLISRHSDGEFITQVVRRLGFGVIRGSTNRHGVSALMEMIRHGREAGHLAITPDGPRGPRRQLQAGVVFLASKTGLPIVPVGFASHQPWRGTSWDRFQLPCPGSCATVVASEPVCVPDNLTDTQLEDWRRRVESALLTATEQAEHWAELEGRLAASPERRPPDSRLRPNIKPPRLGQRWDRVRSRARLSRMLAVEPDSVGDLNSAVASSHADAS